MKPSRSFCKPLCAVVHVAKFGRFWTVFGTVDHKVVLFLDVLCYITTVFLPWEQCE